MDKLSLDRLNILHPKIREKAIKAYTDANNKLGKGARLRISYGNRSHEEQAALHAQGRLDLSEINRLRSIAKMQPIDAKEAKNIVTNAKAGDSYHNYGLAFDIVIIYDNNNDGVFEEASWDTNKDFDKDGVSDWLEVTKILVDAGFQNGFIKNGKKWDLPHFQMNLGYSVKQLKQKFIKGEFIPGTQYLNL